MKIKRGTTSKRRLIFIADSSSTTGAGLANLVFNSAGLVAYYYASDLANEVQITLVTATLGTYTSGGLVAVDNTNMPGWYEFGIPDAALDGGTEAVIQLMGATNMVPVNIYIELDSVDYQDTVRFGLTSIPNVAQGNSGALPTGDASGRITLAPITHSGATIPVVTTVTNGVTVSDKTGFSLASNGLNLVTSWTVAITGNITGNLSGSVGSISGVTFPANFAALGIQAGGQITSVGTVDELGANALDANGAVNVVGPVVWEQLTTTTWPANSFGKHVLISSGTQRTVAVTGSNHVAADIHELQPGVITGPDFDSTALVAIADSVLGRNTSTSTYDAGDVGYVLRQVYSMIVADGVDWQYTANALELAPAGGGGGGGTDWTANERTAIRSILGFNSSGVISYPSEGVLDAIKDKTDLITSGSVQTSLPVTASGQITGPLYIGDDYLNANGRAFSWTVALPTGYVLGTSTCRLGMQYMDEVGEYSFVVTGTVIDAGSGNVTLRFDVPKATNETLAPGWYRWSVEHRDAAGVEITRVASGIKKEVEWREKQT